MRAYCTEAKKYGDEKVPINGKLKKVLVIINPVANKRNCEENFNDYCAPIINLAGYMIEIVKTQADNHAIRYIEEEMTENPDVIVVAGGDGLASEVVTGIMRKASAGGEVPTIGVLPLGQFNQFSLSLINGSPSEGNKVEAVRAMAEGALAIVKGNAVKKDVMKIELISDDEEAAKKNFYAVGSIHWGAFGDILRKRDKYWITGGLRNYSAMLFNGGFARKDVNWNNKAKIIYSPPCEGCSNCYQKIESQNQKLHKSRWWSKFNAIEKEPEYSKILNPQCLETAEIEIQTSELAITTNLMEGKNKDISKLNIKVNPSHDDHGVSYIWNSWKRVSDRAFLDLGESKNFNARQFTLFPVEEEASNEQEEEKECYFTIDNNQFEVRPIKVTVLPKSLNIFVPSKLAAA